MLVDGELVEEGRVKDFAAASHGIGECCEFAWAEATLEDGHEQRCDARGCDGFIDDTSDEPADFCVGKFVAVALMQDDVDGMDAHDYLDAVCGRLCALKDAGSRSARVHSPGSPCSAGKKMRHDGSANSAMV